jgi:hypothetical protein
MEWHANRRTETEKRGNIFNDSDEFDKAATGKKKLYVTYALQIQ